MKKSLLFTCLASVYLAGCSSVPMLTDLDVLKHQNRGDLTSFYRSIQTDLKTAEPKSDLSENRKVFLEKVGRKIAEEKEQVIFNGLDREFEKHAISKLQAALDSGQDIQTYNQAVYLDFSTQLQQAMTQKRGVIAAKEAEFNKLTDKNAPEKVAKLDEILVIFGDGAEAQQVTIRKNEYIRGLMRSAEQALANKRHEDVAMYLDNLEKIDPHYPNLKQMRNRLIASEFEGQFWDAVENGNADKVYDNFYKLTQIPDYIASHPDVAQSADVIALYFVEEGDKMVTAKSFDTAYLFYSRARYMNNVMGKGGSYTPNEKKFVDEVNKRLVTYADKSVTAPAYGLLLILQELMPDHPSILKYSQGLESAIHNDANFKIISAGFSSQATQGSMGVGIVAKVNQKLLQKLPKDLQIIDGIAAQNDYRAAQIITKTNPSSYLFLSGELLDAKVNITETPSSVTKRVLTGYEKAMNPEYTTWNALDDDDKETTPKPPMFVDKAVEENVTITKVEVKKEGVLSITYRLANAVNASVVFSDAMNKKDEKIGENTQGVEMGLFVQKAKTAELPSDDVILQKLSEDASEEIAQKLADQVKLLQKGYVTKGDQSVILEDFNTATASYAYSTSINKRLQKEKEIADASGEEIAEPTNDEPIVDVSGKLKTYALRWK